MDILKMNVVMLWPERPLKNVNRSDCGAFAMKCPKCNYTSFDYNQVCPKCENDNTQEQTRLNLSPNKPNPPFFLASLVEMAGSGNLEIPADGDHTPSAPPPEEMDAQELLIALDDLQPDGSQPDSLEPLDTSTDEIVFDTDDSKADTLEPFDPSEDEILFDLEPASGEDEVESISIDPLDKKGFSDFEAPDVKRVNVDTVELQEESSEIIDEKDLFQADEPENLKMPSEKTGPVEIDLAPEETDSQELFLSLDDLPGAESKPDTAETPAHEDEIIFELEEDPKQMEPPVTRDTSVETESTPEEIQSLFLKETEDITDEVDLFSEDEPSEPMPILEEETYTEIKNEADDSQELFLSLDDLPGVESKPDTAETIKIEEDDIAFDLEEAQNQEETPKSPDQKGFWDSDEIENQMAALNLEESVTKTTDTSSEKTNDKKMEVNVFSDLDIEPLEIEPLDLELSLDDIEKKS
jgi:hypothetical protein